MRNNLFTRYYFDGNVTMTMILIGALSLFVLAFRFKAARPCQAVTIISKDSVYYQNAPVSFSVSAKDADRFEWDFGDGSPTQITRSSTAVHTFHKWGTFVVAVLVNGKCDDTKKVHIERERLVVDTRLAPIFSGPDSAFVNKPVTFTDETPDATSWEWYFDEEGSVVNTNRTAMYHYTTPGLKTVMLKINGRPDRVSSRSIFIMKDPTQLEEKGETKPKKPIKNQSGGIRRPNLPDAPVTPDHTLPPPPEVKKAPEISKEALEGMLKKVASGEKTTEDFSAYLCDNLNIEVVYNGEKMTFLEMYNNIKALKKERKIKSIETIQHRNENDGCIKSLTVTLKKATIILGVKL